MPPPRVPLKYTRTVNRVVGGVTYWHHRVTGQDLGELAERLGWQHGDDLHGEIRGDSLIVRRKKGGT